MAKYGLGLLAFLFLFASCKKSTDEGSPIVQSGSANISFSYKIDSNPLVYDTLRYQNAAGNKYSITRLFYYISSISFYKSDNSSITLDKVIYMDAAAPNQILHLDAIPEGSYSYISFCIGVSPSHNITDSLPATYENLFMAWPPDMGGGYHFMKLEGHYLDAQQVERGFTMHLGTNAALVQHNKIPITLTVTKNQTASFSLQMNISEWFTHPYNYNFITDGNYTMGNAPLMQLISNNGKDIFSNH